MNNYAIYVDRRGEHADCGHTDGLICVCFFVCFFVCFLFGVDLADLLKQDSKMAIALLCLLFMVWSHLVDCYQLKIHVIEIYL